MHLLFFLLLINGPHEIYTLFHSDPFLCFSSAAMLEEKPEPSTPTSPSLLIRPRREPFEYGLLPISKLIFSDGTLTLAPLKEKLLQTSTDGRVSASQLAEALQIPHDYACLAIDTLASVLPADPDPNAGADVHDLILFLYIQTYKRLLPRAHKDSAAVADVWPSTSAFDGYLSALSPLQVGVYSDFISPFV